MGRWSSAMANREPAGEREPVVFIDIGADFSPYLGPRYSQDGDFSGEEFRDKVLVPALDRAQEVVVRLDGIKGYTASFLEEAFGGLVRTVGAEAASRIKFDATRRAPLAVMIRAYIDDAVRRAG